jgi:PAS domain S-box-containing protein
MVEETCAWLMGKHITCSVCNANPGTCNCAVSETKAGNEYETPYHGYVTSMNFIHLSETEHVSETIFSALNDAVLVCLVPDQKLHEATIIYANPAFETLTGYKSAELTNQSVSFFYDDSAKTALLQLVAEAFTRKCNFKTRLIGQRADESLYRTETVFHPIFDDGGRLTHFFTINKDIGELHKLNETLHLQSSILDQVQNAVIVLDQNSKIMFWNTYAEEIYQYTADEMIGSSRVLRLVHPSCRQKYTEAMRELVSSGTWSGELIMQRKNGGRFIALVSNRVLLNYDGEVIGYIGVITDISLQKEIQAELENSLKEKEVLLKEIHHRVKNNMQIISSLLFLQSMQSDDKLIQDILIESQNRVRSMSMVHEKLYRSHNLSKIQFDDYIEELTWDLMNTWVGNNKVISKEFNLESVQLDIDKAIPCGLLLNELISNALKHGLKNMDTGIIQISLKKSGNRYYIVIANDGNRLPENFSLDQNETLGMQLIGSLTRQLNGDLTYEREPRTTFRLTFPEGDL